MKKNKCIHIESPLAIRLSKKITRALEEANEDGWSVVSSNHLVANAWIYLEKEVESLHEEEFKAPWE